MDKCKRKIKEKVNASAWRLRINQWNFIERRIDNLKKMPIWVNWKLEERNGKKTKIPYNPRTGGKAQSNNPHTWSVLSY